MSYTQLLVRNVTSREQGKQLASIFGWQIIELASETSCHIDKHFIEETKHSRKFFDAYISVQLENVPCDKDQARKCRKQFER